jgi:hypothetical protein
VRAGYKWASLRNSAGLLYRTVEILYEKDNVLTPDLWIVSTKVHIISAQAVGKIPAREKSVSTSGPGRCWSTLPVLFCAVAYL